MYAKTRESEAVFARLWQGTCVPASYLRRVFQFGEFFNVVHQTKELPWRIDFRAAAQREAIEPFVVAQIRKHRLDRRKSSPILLASTRRIDARLHAHGVRFARLQRVGFDASTKECDVSNSGRVRCAYALRAQRARHAITFRATKMFADVIRGDVRAPLAIERFPARTRAHARVCVVHKSVQCEVR